MDKRWGLILLLPVLLVVFVSTIYFMLRKSDKDDVEAATGSVTLTAKTDWEFTGATNNLTDTISSPGDVKIDMSSVEVTVESITSDGSVTGTLTDTTDGNTATGVSVASGNANVVTYFFDHSYKISEMRFYSGDQDINAAMNICVVPGTGAALNCAGIGYPAYKLLSAFAGNWPANSWKTFAIGNIETNEVKLVNGGSDVELREAEFTGVPEGATHISAPTQVDGSTTLESWDTFAPSQTVPANTTLTYQFRSSVDGVSWPDDWSVATAYSGSPLDISGITARRYLQVKSNFANSDGASTPTLSAYTVNYTRDDTCDNFDHLDISPATASLETNGTTTFTASAQDASHNPLTGITYNWSATGGSISGGNYTAPATAGTYTVTVTSSCGGSADATVTVTEPDVPDPPPVCTAPNYFDCGDACGPVLTIIEPTEGSIHYTGDTLNISFTPKNSCGGVMYHAEEIRYRVKLSLDGGLNYITLAEDLHDINFPNEAAWLSIMQDANWTTLIQPTIYSYAVPSDASFVTSTARIRVFMYRADAHPHSYSPSAEAVSDQFIIKSGEIGIDGCGNYQVRFSEPKELIPEDRNIDTYFSEITPLDKKSWPTFSYKFKASLFNTNTNVVIRNIGYSRITLDPQDLGTVNPDGSLSIDQVKYPKPISFKVIASDDECSKNAFLEISSEINDDGIGGNFIDILVPDGGERWKIDNDYEIKWRFKEDDPRVVLYDIYLSLDSGDSYPITVAQNLPDDETFAFGYHIPDGKELLSDKAKIKIVGKDQEKRTLLVGRSENDFMIYQSLLGAIVKVIEDNITTLLLMLMAASAVTSIVLLLTPLLSNQLTLSSIPEIFWGIIAKGKSKKKRWGQVYEATSGMPIPNVRLELISIPDNRVVETTLSNSEGYFGFVAPKGSYIIETTKFGFESVNHQKSFSRDTLAMRDNYFGGEISIEGEGDKIIKVNIPLISSKESPRFVTIAKSFNILQNFLIIINWPLLLLGTVISIVALYLTPTLLNLLILALYVPLWAYEVYLLFEPKSYGNVEREENHIPIDLALVRVLDPESRKLVRSVASNQRGRYTLLLPKGSYHQYAQKAGYNPSREKSIYLEHGINSVHTNFGLKSRESDFAQTG